MSVVWEEPPNTSSRGFRERSPQRKEMDMMLEELKLRPGQWARLWDFAEKEDAEKKAGTLRSIAGKGFNVSIRTSDHGFSIYARRSAEKPEQDTDREATFQ